MLVLKFQEREFSEITGISNFCTAVALLLSLSDIVAESGAIKKGN